MTKDWQRLADAVVRRRAELDRMTQAELAHRASISLDRVQAIEGNKSDRYRPVTLMAVERALEWDDGSVAEVLAGGDPRPRAAGPPDGLDEPLTEAEIDQIAAEADEILSRLEGRIASDRNRAQMEAARRLVRWVVEEETNRSGSS